jgi:hypothetical protein
LILYHTTCHGKLNFVSEINNKLHEARKRNNP